MTNHSIILRNSNLRLTLYQLAQVLLIDSAWWFVTRIINITHQMKFSSI